MPRADASMETPDDWRTLTESHLLAEQRRRQLTVDEAKLLMSCEAAHELRAQRPLMRRPSPEEVQRAAELLHGGPLVDEARDEPDVDDAHNWIRGAFKDEVDEVDEDGTWFAAAPPPPATASPLERRAQLYRYRECPLPGGTPLFFQGQAVFYSAGEVHRQMWRRMLAAPAELETVPLCVYPLILEHLPLESWARLALCSAPWADAVAEALENPEAWSNRCPHFLSEAGTGMGRVIEAMLTRRRAPEIERSYGTADNLVARLTAIHSASGEEVMWALDLEPGQVAGWIKRVLDDLDINHLRLLLKSFHNFDFEIPDPRATDAARRTAAAEAMEECGWAANNLKEFLPLLDASDRVLAIDHCAELLVNQNEFPMERHAFFFLNCFGSLMGETYHFGPDYAEQAALAAAELQIIGPSLVAIIDLIRAEDAGWNDQEEVLAYEWVKAFLRTWSQAADFPASADPASRASIFEFLAAQDVEFKRAVGPALWAWGASLGRAVDNDPTAGEAIAALGDALVVP